VSDRHGSARRDAVRGTVSVALVLALAGVMFTANARLARDDDDRHPQDLGELAERESSRVQGLTAQVDGLRAEVERLTGDGTNAVDTGDPDHSALVALAAGRAAVTGPGLTVRLSDAPAGGPRRDDVQPDDLVVHQQDLQAVINALWAGGAEAMALQDQRVTATTAFRCVGNVLSLGGRVYSPPYEVRAIGDPRALREALLASPDIQRYLDWVDAVGLGWSVTTEEVLELPAAEGGVELEHAAVPDGVDVFPGRVGAAASSSEAEEAQTEEDGAAGTDR
jgi:uncharacterized protein YlxW (UPF0749 family)